MDAWYSSYGFVDVAIARCSCLRCSLLLKGFPDLGPRSGSQFRVADPSAGFIPGRRIWVVPNLGPGGPDLHSMLPDPGLGWFCLGQSQFKSRPGPPDWSQVHSGFQSLVPDPPALAGQELGLRQKHERKYSYEWPSTLAGRSIAGCLLAVAAP